MHRKLVAAGNGLEQLKPLLLGDTKLRLIGIENVAEFLCRWRLHTEIIPGSSLALKHSAYTPIPEERQRDVAGLAGTIKYSRGLGSEEISAIQIQNLLVDVV